MTDSAEKMREAEIGRCYKIGHDGFVGTVIGHYTTIEGKEGVVLQQVGTRVVHVYGRKWIDEDAALSASGTKSDGEVKEPSASIPDYNGVKSPALVTAHGLSGKSCPLSRVAPGLTDIIPSQPDERERIQQIIELAMIEEAEIQYADFADRDRQREKIITSAAAAILAMLAERRGAEPRGCPTPGACSCPPAPIAGLEPVAWQLRYAGSNHPWVNAEKANTSSDIEWRGLVPVAQAEAHAAEQVRAEREACAKIAEGMPHMLPMGEKHIRGLKGIDVAAAIRARGQV